MEGRHILLEDIISGCLDSILSVSFAVFPESKYTSEYQVYDVLQRLTTFSCSKNGNCETECDQSTLVKAKKGQLSQLPELWKMDP